MTRGSNVIVCAVTLLLALSCGADRLINRQRAFETIMTQDITMLNDKVSKMQENIEILTQMVNASLQQNGQAPDGSHTAVQNIERKLSRTSRQLNAAFANQKMAISSELALMGETISSTREEMKEQAEEVQKKVLTIEISMQRNAEKILANIKEGCANSIKTQMDDVLLQIHNHEVSVGTQLQGIATATAQDRTTQLVEEISNHSETTDTRVAGIETVLQKTTSDLMLAMNKLISLSSADIRLTGGGNTGSGRIEVRRHGIWGTICDDGFDGNNNGAIVVCRMLGYTSSVPTKSYGQGSGPIWMDDVTCTGGEYSILDCPRSQFGKHNCDHSEDVGVDCS